MNLENVIQLPDSGTAGAVIDLGLPPAPAPAAALLDDAGTVFDPAIHAVDDAGNPAYRVAKKLKGKRIFARRRGGFPPPGSKVGGVSDIPCPTPAAAAVPLVDPDASPTPAAAPSGPPPSPEDIETAAAQLVGLEQILCLSVFGEEWLFADAERQALVSGWVRMMQEKGLVSSPWWVDVAAAHALLYVARMNKPQTRARVGVLKLWLIGKYVSIRQWWAARRKGEAHA